MPALKNPRNTDGRGVAALSVRLPSRVVLVHFLTTVAVLSMLVVGSVFLFVSTGSVTKRFTNSPENLHDHGLDGLTYLVHDGTGVRLRLVGDPAHTSLPVLLDGTWRAPLTGRRDVRIVIGGAQHSDPPPDPRDLSEALLTCWTRPQSISSRLPAPEGVRCTQSLMTNAAALHGYSAVSAAIEMARAGLSAQDASWGWYCGIAGESAATGAVLRGEDPRGLMRKEQSFCDYSVLHGTGTGVVLRNPDNVVSALKQTCAPQKESFVPPTSQESQCWHGGGIGIARITGMDIEKGAIYCGQAPSPVSARNCAEGMFAFARTYLLRYEISEPQPGRLLQKASTCMHLSVSHDVLNACYRSVGQHLLRTGNASRASSTDARKYAVEQMQRSCEHIRSEHGTSCWSGFGFLIAMSLHPDVGDHAIIREWVVKCSDADTADAVYGCYERALLGLLRNDQLTSGVDPEYLLAMAPPHLRERLHVALDQWLASLVGRST